MNCNHPVVRDLIMTCLRYWVGDMHVDGFRFDLASILGRDRKGNVMVEPPVIEAIAEDGVLADTKLIAEPWDAAGLYQVGGFPFGRRWSEWNGQLPGRRAAVLEGRRRAGRPRWPAGSAAARTCTSGAAGCPRHSVNFVTCHDGFTLYDLVSYNDKHNDANGEGNRDGHERQLLVELRRRGARPTDPAVLALRQRQAKDLMATLMLVAGRADAPGRGRVPAHAEGEQQRLVPGQRHLLGRLDAGGDERRLPAVRPGDDLAAAAAPGPAAAAVLRRRDPVAGGGGAGVAAGPARSRRAGPVRPAEAGLPGDAGVHSADATGRPTDAAGRPPSRDAARPWPTSTGTGSSRSSRTSATTRGAWRSRLDGRFTGREQDDDYHLDCDFYVAMNAWHEPLRFRVPPSPTRPPVAAAGGHGRGRRRRTSSPRAKARRSRRGRRCRWPPHGLVVLVSEAV